MGVVLACIFFTFVGFLAGFAFAGYGFRQGWDRD